MKNKFCSKSKKTTFLCCLFGGFLGMHYFYVGRILKGFLFMFTFGLIFVWLLDLVSIDHDVFIDKNNNVIKGPKIFDLGE